MIVTGSDYKIIAQVLISITYIPLYNLQNIILNFASASFFLHRAHYSFVCTTMLICSLYGSHFIIYTYTLYNMNIHLTIIIPFDRVGKNAK